MGRCDMKYRVRQRYHDSGRVTVTITTIERNIETGKFPKPGNGQFTKYDQYDDDFEVLADAQKFAADARKA